MAAQSNSKSILFIIIAILLGVVAYAVLNKPDDRNAIQKVGDAIEREDARELKDRTPGERIGDAVEDAADKVTPSNTTN